MVHEQKWRKARVLSPAVLYVVTHVAIFRHLGESKFTLTKNTQVQIGEKGEFSLHGKTVRGNFIRLNGQVLVALEGMRYVTLINGKKE